MFDRYINLQLKTLKYILRHFKFDSAYTKYILNEFTFFFIHFQGFRTSNFHSSEQGNLTT